MIRKSVKLSEEEKKLLDKFSDELFNNSVDPDVEMDKFVHDNFFDLIDKKESEK